MTDIQLEPTETWMPDFPSTSVEEARERITIRCSDCDKILKPIETERTFYYKCNDCSYCKQCGGHVEKVFVSDSPSCGEMVWQCSKCGVRK